MSYDVVALVAENPDLRTLTRALEDAGADLRVGALAGGGLLQLRDSHGVLLTLEPGQAVEAPGEVERLLGPDLGPGLPVRFWWVELRARPDDAGRKVAHRVADRLALRLGGAVWTSGPADFGVWEETPHPTVEHSASRAVVVAQDREVVPYSSWIADALTVHASRGDGFQLLTPTHTRLTYSLRTLMTLPLARWVVRDEAGGHYDGISGLPLRWDPEHGHVPVRRVGDIAPAEGFLDDSPTGRQLVLEATLRFPESDFTPGRSVELMAERLRGSLPIAWGQYEPALTPWDGERLVRLVRHRAPRTTLVRFRGNGFCGDLRVSHDSGTVREEVSLVLGYEGADAFPYDHVPSAAASLAEGLEVLHVRRMRGRADCTYAPRWYGLAEPVGFAVGSGRAEAAEELSGRLKGARVGDAVWFAAPKDATREQALRLMAARIRRL